VITYLVILLCCLALAQPKGCRRHVALFYAAACLFLDRTHQYYSGYEYYLVSGTLSLLFLWFTCLRGKSSQFTDNMVYVGVTSLLLNFYGLVIYQLYMSPVGYDTAFSGLYILVMVVLLKGDKDHDIVRNWLSVVRLPTGKCSHPGSEICEEARL
jgi:hypothetical protein